MMGVLIVMFLPQAASLLKGAMKRDPENAVTILQLAELHTHDNNFDQAVKLLLKARRLVEASARAGGSSGSNGCGGNEGFGGFGFNFNDFMQGSNYKASASNNSAPVATPPEVLSAATTRAAVLGINTTSPAPASPGNTTITTAFTSAMATPTPGAGAPSTSDQHVKRVQRAEDESLCNIISLLGINLFRQLPARPEVNTRRQPSQNLQTTLVF